MLFRYPNNSTEVRNMDYLLQRVEEINQKFDEIISGELEEIIDEYFNKVMIDAIYDEEHERIILKKELIVGDGIHTYNAETNTMTIEED